MNKNEATQKIAQLLAQNVANLDEAVALADEHDVSFHFSTPERTNITYIPQNGKRPTLQQYWDGEYDEDEMYEENGDYNFAGWQNSSTFC